MAKCDQGYLCRVCGEPVKGIHESSLYLHFVIGDIPPRALLTQHDQHLSCNPQLTQFIVCDDYSTPAVEGETGKALMDESQRIARERLVTAGYLRLKFLHQMNLSLSEYPFSPEMREKIEQGEIAAESFRN